jgi:hypothetical protein
MAFVMLCRFIAAAIVAAVTAMAAEPAPVFHKDVLPILQKDCQTCHRPGEVAPMSFLSYGSTRPWAKAIKSAVLTRKMPPWFADPRHGHFSNAPKITDDDIQTLAAWADAGAPEGNPKDAPPPVRWTEGWQIQPDHIAKMPPYPVPAKGIQEWSYVTIPSGFTQDTWVTSIEIRPGDRSVMHHVVVFFKPHSADVNYGQPVWFDVARDSDGITKPGQGFVNRRLVNGSGEPVSASVIGGAGSIEAVYVPGVPPMDYGKHNAAKLIPANTDLVVQLHYTPNGKDVTDVTQIGFTIAKEPPPYRFITYSPQTPAIADRNVFRIPAGDSNWKSPPVDGTFNVDAELVWMMPHMHVRGKDMTYSLTYPSGESEIVLSVPKYDFEWQLGYDVAKPIKAPKGTKLHVDAHYDNSANNKFNPDPTKDVFSGTQTWEEMMAPFFGVIVDRRIDPKKVMDLREAAGGA